MKNAEHGQEKAAMNPVARHGEPRCPLMRSKKKEGDNLLYVRAWCLRRHSVLAGIKKTPHDFLLTESRGDICSRCWI